MDEVRFVTPETREHFQGRACDMLETFALPEQTTELAFWRDDKVLAIWRGTIQWPGVAFLAGAVSDEARGDNVVTLVRQMARMLLGWAYEHRLRRVSGYVLADQEEYIRFAELMGFEEEARLYGAAPDGGDLVLMTRHFRWMQSSANRRPPRRHPSTTARCGVNTRDG